MISIIVSSYQEKHFIQFSKNIKSTIGNDIEYEIIQQWNPGLMGTCEAYNKGAEKAKYPYLVFCHEDILFETKDWGSLLLKSLTIKNVGVVGIAGSNYYGFIPSGCWSPTYFQNINQFANNKFNLYDKVNFEHIYEKVKVIDGVFLACKKTIYSQIKFDEHIKGYHGYDLIFTLNASKKFQNIVTSEILIKHLSLGNINQEWLLNIIQVRKLIGFDKSVKINKSIEMQNFNRLIDLLYKTDLKYFKKISIILSFCNIRILGFFNVLKIINRIKYIKFNNS